MNRWHTCAGNNTNSKTTDKLNNNVRKALAQANIKALLIEGFERFSYTVEWQNFPNSLKVNCHFPSPEALKVISSEENKVVMIKVIQSSFLKQGIKFKDVRANVLFAQ